mmetsp:Transcript_15642/g.51181  ORF Transcript_15642/g.51181 Transcript_15642/m.51181 type:complete len:215 (+) Transcript_15642:126-770(+)
MKRARWGATHRIHEHFVDGFPELEERFVREREAAERRFEYNLGSRNFATKREGEEGIDTLKVLFRKLDRAIGLRDATMVQTIREEFLAELRHWNWRKGARVEFKRRKLVHDNARLSIDDNNAAMALAETLRKSNADDLRGPEFPPPPSGGRGNTTKNDTNNNGEKKNKKKTPPSSRRRLLSRRPPPRKRSRSRRGQWGESRKRRRRTGRRRLPR